MSSLPETLNPIYVAIFKEAISFHGYKNASRMLEAYRYLTTAPENPLLNFQVQDGGLGSGLGFGVVRVFRVQDFGYSLRLRFILWLVSLMGLSCKTDWIPEYLR